MRLQKYLQPWKLIVQDQTLRKHGLMNKISSICKVADVFRPVAVTGKKQREIIFAAAAQDLETVFSGIPAISVRRQGCFVDLKDRAGCFCGSGKDIIINRIMSIITMSQDLDTGIFHYIDKSFSVLVTGTTALVPAVHAGDCIVKFT